MIRLPGRRSSKAGSLPPQVGAGLGLLAADQVLASGVDSATGGYAVLSQHHLSLVSPTGRVAFSRPWHEVRSGSWDPVTGTISATWAAGGRGTMLTFGPGHDHVADVFRERVQASVVTSEQILLYDDDGPASAGRVYSTTRLLIGVSSIMYTGNNVQVSFSELVLSDAMSCCQNPLPINNGPAAFQSPIY